MTHNFNSYIRGLDLEFLKTYCMEKGKLLSLSRGEILEDVGKPAQWVAYVVKGCFKYIVRNEVEAKDYITGFVFEREFVADYPNCLYGTKSEIRIEANTPCEVYAIRGNDLLDLYEESEDKASIGRHIAEHLFMQTYSRFLDHYRLDARGRYEHLIARCPDIVQQLSLKEIASFLNMTPQMLSKIRKDITFG